MNPMEEIKSKVATLETAVEDLKTRDEKILDELSKINQTLARQKGFIGGVIFVCSAMATAFGIAVDYFRH